MKMFTVTPSKALITIFNLSKVNFLRFYFAIKMGIQLKPVLSGHSKKEKTKILMTDGSFMKVESIAECSAILLTCIKQ